MKLFILIFKSVLILNLTASFAQTGDSLTCYTNIELKRIAHKVVQANECDKLLDITNNVVKLKDSIIITQQTLIDHKDTTLLSYERKYTKSIMIINKQEMENEELIKQNKKLKHHKIYLILISGILIMKLLL